MSQPAEAQSEPINEALEERFSLCHSIAEECLGDLRTLLREKDHPVCYDGFEPSGRMHIAQGILKALTVNSLTKAGCKFIFWVADWFALMNNKMGGSLEKIQDVGRYMIEVWKAAGMDLSMVEFRWASAEIDKDPANYWGRVMDIARVFSASRIVRCSTIMGREETDELSVAQLMYPCMQCADIFFLKADICQLGMDQRKVNVLALEYCEKKKIKRKPVSDMLMGLKEGMAKMSKSDPFSAIFMEDEEDVVNEKVDAAYCPEGTITGNPCMDYLRWIVFPAHRAKGLDVDVGGRGFQNYKDLEEEYIAGRVRADVIKHTLKTALNALIQPVRDHFVRDPQAAELLQRVRSYRTTK